MHLVFDCWEVSRAASTNTHVHLHIDHDRQFLALEIQVINEADFSRVVVSLDHIFLGEANALIHTHSEDVGGLKITFSKFFNLYLTEESCQKISLLILRSQ